jgi:hypothetical protein
MVLPTASTSGSSTSSHNLISSTTSRAVAGGFHRVPFTLRNLNSAGGRYWPDSREHIAGNRCTTADVAGKAATPVESCLRLVTA